MKKKAIIIVTLVVLLALGGTLAFAAVDEDGQLVNPFRNILSGKVEDGTITQEDADIFTRVWEAIKGDHETGRIFEGKDGRMGGMMDIERPEVNHELMEEIGEAIEAKTTEIINELISEGILDADAIENTDGRGMYFLPFIKDADEETAAALKEAAEEIHEYIESLIEAKVADGTLTQEEADMFQRGGMRPGMPFGEEDFRGRPNFRKPAGEFKRPIEGIENPEA